MNKVEINKMMNEIKASSINEDVKRFLISLIENIMTNNCTYADQCTLQRFDKIESRLDDVESLMKDAGKAFKNDSDNIKIIAEKLGINNLYEQ